VRVTTREAGAASGKIGKRHDFTITVGPSNSYFEGPTPFGRAYPNLATDVDPSNSYFEGSACPVLPAAADR